MAVRTHDSKWRSLVGAAPLLGVAFLFLAAVQGEPEILKSPPVLGILAAVAAVALLVSGWTARSLRATVAVPVAQAQPGLVALRGRAQAIPGMAPLLSPNGTPCLWFKHSQQVLHRYDASDSVRPFLLVDDSGTCMVLPAGADITGSSKAVAPPTGTLHRDYDLDSSKTSRIGLGERLLLEGEQIHVVGWFTPLSQESLDRQVQAARLVEKTELSSVVIRGDGPASFAQAVQQARHLRTPDAPALPAPAPPPAPTALPVIGASSGTAPFIVSIGSADGQASLYGFLAVVDALVLAASGAMYLFLR